MLTDGSGHYDLLYQSEDITEMSIGGLRNPEVRFLSEPLFPSFGNIGFSHADDLGDYMADFPGFTLGMPATTISSEIYQSLSNPSPIQSIPDPTSAAPTNLTQTALNAAISENNSYAKKSASPPSQENTTEPKFRNSRFQLEYQDCRARLRSQQAQAGVMGWVYAPMTFSQGLTLLLVTILI